MDISNDENAGPLWQRIRDAIRDGVLTGRYRPGGQLPSERELSLAHGASRMTTRRALAALEQEGLIRIQHGNGTFVSDAGTIRYHLGGHRVRFNQSMRSTTEDGALSRKVIRSEVWSGDAEVAARLALPPEASILSFVTIVYDADRPVSVVTRHCDAIRFAGLDVEFARLTSLTEALRLYGIADYRRTSTEIMARLPTIEEARLLEQSRSQPVLVYAAIDATDDGPIAWQQGCFAAQRVSIMIDPQEQP